MPEIPAPSITEQIRARRIAELKTELQSHKDAIARQEAEIEVKSAQLKALEATPSK